MNSWDWNNQQVLQTARQRFRDELAKPEHQVPGGLQEQCIKYPWVARRTFARLGEFYLQEDPKPAAPDDKLTPIPVEIEFRVFPEDVYERRKMVVLVARGLSAQKDDPDPTQVWQCTYYPYKPHMTGETPSSEG